MHLGIGFIERRKCAGRTCSKITVFEIVGLSYSALDLQYYWEESNETVHNGRIYIIVVHLGIGFIERQNICR